MGSPDQKMKSLNLKTIEQRSADEQKMSIEKETGALNLENDKQTFEVLLQVKQFRPSEMNVKIAGRKVIVSAKHEIYADDHGFVSREFTRKYNLPNAVEPEDLVTFLSQDGVLTIKTYDESDLRKKIIFLEDLEKALNQEESLPAEGVKQKEPLPSYR
ncbi:protein lethal(2)essential for life-like [Stegodyphus dumicola]|uniref:protein lethal(2)essential for life-like n=1 Tax=Stegodyphus dumicola TaxID=202533 RepID=UPI0015A964F1|nr:protein lethal(2)essential for life-like [Stegodyphus dumicola]